MKKEKVARIMRTDPSLRMMKLVLQMKIIE